MVTSNFEFNKWSWGQGRGGGGDNTTEFERPIGRKAKKVNRKRKDGDKDFGEYLAKKLHYIEEAHEQEKEALWIKAFE